MSTRLPTIASRERFNRILEALPGLLSQHPEGMHLRELIAELKAPDHTIGRALTQLRKKKLVSLKGRNIHAIWTMKQMPTAADTPPQQPFDDLSPRQKGGDSRVLAIRGAKDRAAIMAAMERVGKPIGRGQIFEALQATNSDIPESSLSTQLGNMQKKGLIVNGPGKTWMLKSAEKHSRQSNGVARPPQEVTIEREYVLRVFGKRKIFSHDEAMNLYVTLKELLRVD